MSALGSRMEWRLELAVRRVARQCRRRRLLHCLFRFGFVTLALVAAFTLALALTPDETARRVVVCGFLLLEGVVAWILLIRPTRAPIDLRQAAMLIDERRPELENRIVTAVEFAESDTDGLDAWLAGRLQEDARLSVEGVSLERLLDARRAARWATLAIASWVGVLACIGLYRNLWLPDISFALVPVKAPPIAPSFRVEPGDVLIRRGESVVVRALLEDVERGALVRWQPANEAWRETSMPRGAAEGVRFHQFANLTGNVDYEVRVGDAVSPVYHIAVWTPPEVDAVNLTYRYPEYLNMPPRESPHGGDISAVEGTEVDVVVRVNKPLAEARLDFDKSDDIALTQSRPNEWTGRLTVAKNDTYSVRLSDDEERTNEYAPKHRVTSIPDDPPEVKIAFPRDDIEVTSLDEPPFEFVVKDDFGLRDYGIQFEVAGREALRVALNDATSSNGAKAEGVHTLMLEYLDLTPGDFVTWAVWANDGKPGREAFETLGFPYFLEIRPFEREFEEAISGQSGQQDQQQQQDQRQQGGDQAATSQKEILIATWNLRREARSLTEAEYETRRARIIESQQGVAGQLAARMGTQPEAATALGETMKSVEDALASLGAAEWAAPSASLSDAIRHMQLAHRLMLKASPKRSQVREQQQQQASSSQQSQQRQQQLNQLESQRNRNFYEEEQRVQEQRAATEQARESLADLTQRQKAINEEISRLISEMADADEQRREELRRQLERLREEERQALQELDQTERDVASGQMDPQQARETNRALQNARQQMTRGLENLEQQQLQQARAAGSRASRSLDEAEQALDRLSREAAGQRMDELRKQMQAMNEREDEVIGQLREFEKQETATGSLRQDDTDREAREELATEKQELAQTFRETLEDASDLAEKSKESQELMSRRLGDWLRETARDEIPERMERSRDLVRYGIWRPAIEEEEKTKASLARATEALDAVAQGAVDSDLDAMRMALDELQDLRDEEQSRRQQANASGEPSGKQQAREGLPPESSEQASPAQERPPQEQQGDQANAQQQPRPGEGQSQPREGDQPQSGQPQEGSQQQSGNQPRQGNQQQQGQPNEQARRGNGAWGEWVTRRSDEEMRRWLEEDSQRWLEGVRDAEALLPHDDTARQDLGRAREALLEMRRRWRGSTTTREEGAPRFDLMQAMVGAPIGMAAERMERSIREREETDRLLLKDEEMVPEKYRKRVADYYRALSDDDDARGN